MQRLARVGALVADIRVARPARGRRHDARSAVLVEAPVMAQVVAVAFACLRAFCAMNFSVASYASSSTICTGGDFIR